MGMMSWIWMGHKRMKKQDCAKKRVLRKNNIKKLNSQLEPENLANISLPRYFPLETQKTTENERVKGEQLT